MAGSQGGGGFSTWMLVAALLGVVAVPQLRSRESRGEGYVGSGLGEAGDLNQHLSAIQGAIGSTGQDGELAPLAHPLRELLRASVGIPVGPDVDLPALASAYREQGHELRPLVVSVPDPEQSHLALYYDQAIVALRQAAASMGFLQGRFFLPWQEVSRGLDVRIGDASVGLGTPPDLRLRVKPTSQDSLPGLMLFRHADGPLLIAILVTESAVLGASVPQLELALKLQAELATPPTLVAPFFSGGVQSFVEALEKLGPTARATFVTGTATSSSVDEALRPRAEFVRVVPTDDAFTNYAITEICKIDNRARFAALAESGTSYGVWQDPEGGKPPTDNDASPEESCRERGLRKLRVFSFPIHISDLRLQSERANGEGPELPPTLRRTIGLRSSIREVHLTDIPKSFAARSASQDDLMLGQVLSRVCDERFKYLLIRATDPSDIIFLASRARRYCQRVRLVTFGYEDLFTHPDLNESLAGSLVVSAYAPSLAISDLVSPLARSNSPRPFPSMVSEGLYNAVLEACGSRLPAPLQEAARDCRPVSGSTMPVSAIDRARPIETPIFLGQVAGARVWPLRSEPTRSRASEPSNEAVLARPPSDGARQVAWLAILGGVLILAARFFRFDAFARCAAEWQTTQCARLFVAELSATLIVGLAIFPLAAERWLVPGFWRPDSSLSSVILGLGVGSGLFALTLKDLVTLVRRLYEHESYQHLLRLARPPHGRRRLRLRHVLTILRPFGLAAFAVVAPIGFAGLILAWLVGLALHGNDWPPSDAAHAMVRLLNPFAMSPALPLLCLCLGVFTWALCALWRVQRLDRFVSRNPRSLHHLPTRALRHLWLELYWPWATAGMKLLACAVVGFASWRIVRRVNDTFEGDAFNLGFMFAFWALSVLVTAEVVRFLTLSGRLIDAARSLAAEPMIGAYDRISKKVSGTFGLQLAARVPPAQELAFSVLSSRTLSSLAIQTWPLWPQVGDLERGAQHVHQSMTLLNQSGSSNNARERAVHDALHSTARTLHGMVAERWRERARGVQPAELSAKLSKQDLLPGGKLSGSPTLLLLENASPFEMSLWIRGAEDFIAVRMSAFVYQVLHELRQTLTFALVGGLLLALSGLAYPFRANQVLLYYAWSHVLIIILIALTRMLALERNELLSRLGGTKPDRIEWSAGFVRQLITFVCLPLAAVVIGVFPGLGEAVGSQLALVLSYVSLAN